MIKSSFTVRFLADLPEINLNPPYTQSKNGVVEARIALIERPRESPERCKVIDTFVSHQIHRFYRDWQATVQECVQRRQGREVSRV